MEVCLGRKSERLTANETEREANGHQITTKAKFHYQMVRGKRPAGQLHRGTSPGGERGRGAAVSVCMYVIRRNSSLPYRPPDPLQPRQTRKTGRGRFGWWSRLGGPGVYGVCQDGEK